MRRIALIILLVIAQGCSTGFDRGRLQANLGPTLINDADVASILKLKPQLPFPFRLGVYFTSPPSYVRSEWQWSMDDKNKVLSWLQPLNDRKLLSDVFVVSDVQSEASDLKSIRLAAARYGADGVLVVSGVGASDRYGNPLMFFDIITLTVTGLFLPGNEQDSLFLVKASLWDVRNSYLYLSAEAEGEDRRTAPLWWNIGREKYGLRLAQDRALENLRQELVPKVRGMH